MSIPGLARSNLDKILIFLFACIAAASGLALPYQPYIGRLALLNQLFGLPLLLCIGWMLSVRYKKNVFILIFPALSIKAAAQTSWLLSHPYYYIIPVWLLLSPLLAAPIAWIYSRWLSSRAIEATPILSASLVSAAAVLYERLLSTAAVGISWQSTALLGASNRYSIQIASCLGRDGLSFLLLFASAVGSIACLKLAANKRSEGLKLAILWLFLSLIPPLFGMARLSFKPQVPEDSVTAAICHMEEMPDIFSQTKIDPWSYTLGEWRKVIHLMRPLERLAKPVNLIVLPEGAIPYRSDLMLIREDALFSTGRHELISSFEAAQLLSKRVQTPLLIGLEAPEAAHSDEEQKIYNSAYFIEGAEEMHGRYDKQLLIPFGEYIPYRWMSPILRNYGIHNSFHPGTEIQLFSIRSARSSIEIAPLICYEETFSQYGLAAKRAGAECLVSMSNDAWFPCRAFRQLHFDLARLQSVELGLPSIRATNKGISGAIDAYGDSVPAETLASSRSGALLLVTVPLYPALR